MEKILSNLDFIARKILKVYRTFLYSIYRLSRDAVLPYGDKCSVGEFKYELNKGDIVHPCIRISTKLFRGHKWWMIYTPYYAANADLENPILCYGIEKNNSAPSCWVPYCEIQPKPSDGYNSDPVMFFENDNLHVYWRENFTPRTDNDSLSRATYGCTLTESERIDFKDPILSEKKIHEDKQISPFIFKKMNKYYAYAMHISFFKPGLNFKNKFLNSITRKTIGILSTLEIYTDQKSHGISVWKSPGPDQKFEYIKTLPIKNCNALYRPWHLDCFEYEDKLYAVVQTTQCNADICLAVSDDYETFKLLPKPLITNDSIKKAGIYKSTAFVHDGIFYLYYTAQDITNRSLNKLYVTSMPFEEVLAKIN